MPCRAFKLTDRTGARERLCHRSSAGQGSPQQSFLCSLKWKKNQSWGHRLNQGISNSYLHSIIISLATSFSIITEPPVKVVCNYLQYVSDSGVSSALMCVYIDIHTNSDSHMTPPKQLNNLHTWETGMCQTALASRGAGKNRFYSCFPFWFKTYIWWFKSSIFLVNSSCHHHRHLSFTMRLEPIWDANLFNIISC